ncbi:hypothetical protein TNIN_231211 [Trichonephila inaurata madagascariensis]|uniref:Uncharacterized protein n=1 Tax=Trichonephila inaurata madagascariensis TaxID=2747483 RepID=A0A8X7CBE7_9ARAC|nr:hypothetical protein TNIN_231211 [Trichonephila inaurata madagascariensis]
MVTESPNAVCLTSTTPPPVLNRVEEGIQILNFPRNGSSVSCCPRSSSRNGVLEIGDRFGGSRRGSDSSTDEYVLR